MDFRKYILLLFLLVTIYCLVYYLAVLSNVWTLAYWTKSFRILHKHNLIIKNYIYIFRWNSPVSCKFLHNSPFSFGLVINYSLSVEWSSLLSDLWERFNIGCYTKAIIVQGFAVSSLAEILFCRFRNDSYTIFFQLRNQFMLYNKACLYCALLNSCH